MSENEKKAIEIIKQEITKPETTPLEVYVTDIKMLLHIIDKKQKEIEELKKPKYILNAETGELKVLNNDYISKDKIREKIKELEKQQEKLKYDGNVCFADYEQFCKNLKFLKEQIQELLEEE